MRAVWSRERETHRPVTCLRAAHRVAGGTHRLDDVLVAGAAAEIGREHVEQLVVADVRIVLQRVRRQHQEARRAEAALQAVVVDEGLLQRMQLLAVGEPFDGADLPAVGLDREHQAGADRLAVEDDRAGAADAVLAADMRAGLAAVVADRVDQRLARLDADRVRAAVDRQRDVDLVAHQRGRMSLNRARMCWSSSVELRTTRGKVSRRPNGLQASITTRALRGSFSL